MRKWYPFCRSVRGRAASETAGTSLLPGEEDSVRRTTAPLRLAATAPPAPKPVNVLMVEDSEDDAQLLLLELRRQGFAPSGVRVETGQALQAALGTRAWDVVISDHNMPGFSGEEALKVVRVSHARATPAA